MGETESVAQLLLGAAREDAKALAALVVLPDIAEPSSAQSLRCLAALDILA